MVRPYLPASNDGHCVCVDVSRCLRIRNHPSDEWVYLHGNEKAAGAVYVLSCALFHLDTSNRIAAGFIRGPVKATSALATNGAVFWWQRSRFNASPFHQRVSWHGANGRSSTQLQEPVFLLRWCEWTPLAGLMTFLAEAVDLPRRKSGIRVRIYSALSIHQLFGIIFPFCHSPSCGVSA
jgi:hypothetical protein